MKKLMVVLLEDIILDQQLETFSDTSDDETENEDLLSKIQKKMGKCDVFIKPYVEQKTLHISCLPMEVLFYIFKWVVTCDLDLRSLEMCSLVCRAFYLCCRDSEIWRLACIR